MNRQDYNGKMIERLGKMIERLNNSGCYKKLDKNPLKNITKEVSNLIKECNIQDKKNLTESCPYTPRIYGAPNTHKGGIPIRHIVNTIGGPTYRLVKYIAKKLKPLVGNIESFVKDSTHLMDVKLQKLSNNV